MGEVYVYRAGGSAHGYVHGNPLGGGGGGGGGRRRRSGGDVDENGGSGESGGGPVVLAHGEFSPLHVEGQGERLPGECAPGRETRCEQREGGGERERGAWRDESV